MPWYFFDVRNDCTNLRDESGVEVENLQMAVREAALTLADVADFIGRALSTVERAAARLQSEGRLRHVGPKKGGRWEVL